MSTTWKDVGNKAAETAKTAGDAVSNTAKAFTKTAVGTGEAAGGAVGGIAGFANRMAKGIANTFLNIVNKGFTLIKNYPRVSALFVTIAAVTGIASWRKRNKIEKSQELEAGDLQASIAANRAARLETSLAMGQDSSFPDTNWRARAKGGLPGQQTTP